jgi:cell division protein FtsQ
LFAILSTVTVMVYLIWANGIVGKTVAAVDRFAQERFVAMGISVQQVTVRGRTRTEKDAILAALDLDRGSSLVHVDLDAARERIEALEWVGAATVMRLLPDTVHVEIDERRPYAIWQNGGRLYLIDRAGRVISDRDVREFAFLPQVVGPGAADAAEALISVLDRVPTIRSRLKAAVRVSGRRWTLKLDNGVDVHLPDKGVEEAIGELTELQREHRILQRDIAAIDLRFKDRFIVRPIAPTEDPGWGSGSGAKDMEIAL